MYNVTSFSSCQNLSHSGGVSTPNPWLRKNGVRKKRKEEIHMSDKKQRSLRTKISTTMIIVVALTLLCVAVIAVFSASSVTATLSQANQQMSQTSRSRSSSSMASLTQTRLLELADDKAELADRLFYEFEEAVSNVAVAAERLYADADSIPSRDVPLPRAENDGALALQVLFATGVDPDDEQIVQEVRLLGNLQEMLYAINYNNPGIVSNYIATESGIMVQADYISAMKLDEAGSLMPLDAKMRPWYQGAAEYGSLFLTQVVEDLHTRRPTVMCGVPIYCDGVLMGVAGAGMYLDNVEALVRGMDLGDTGAACIVNQFGQVLFSSDQEAAGALLRPGQDLLGSGVAALTALGEKAVNRESGVMQLELNNASCYVAFAPMTATGWSVFVILSQEEVDRPTAQLQVELDRIAQGSSADAEQHMRAFILMLLAVLVVALIAALIASLVLSVRIATPIQLLTEKVSRIEGDNLDFHWDMETGDETQMLAASFESLTERMKSYISDIQSVTAEKERIGTELSLAAHIQSDMLPSTFPAFPDRQDFDVFASMDPARAVGGDFYDFFLIDDDHLALVIGDVSGKGIPAALYMMSTSILITDRTNMGGTPGEILSYVNSKLCTQNKSDMFVTVWLGILELSTGRLTAANAGHEYPAVKRAGGGFELFRDSHSFILGGMDGITYKDYELLLSPGDKIFVYTDGVPEATDAENRLFGKERMLAALNEAADKTPEQILQSVRDGVETFVKDAEQFDDLTMLCLEFRGRVST